MEDGNLWKYSKDKFEREFVRKSLDLPLISPPNGHDNHKKTHDVKYTYKCEIKTSVGDDSKKVINPLKICIGKRLRTSQDDEYSEIKRRSLSQNECKQSEPRPINRTLCNPTQLKKIKAAKDVPNDVIDRSISKIVNTQNVQHSKKGQLSKGSHFKEYAEYLGLQQTVKFKCRKCCTMSFKSLAVLKEHQRVCRGHAETIGPPPEASSGRTTRKVYLCSACGTYYENWNLFLHMREVHNRHICLFCLGMFSRAEKLAAHLSAKHNVVEMHYDTAAQFLETNSGSLYLMCCSCDTVYTEKDNFSSHECKTKELKDQLKQPTANQNSLNKIITSKSSKSIELETNTKLTIEQSDKLALKPNENALNNIESTKTNDEATVQKLDLDRESFNNSVHREYNEKPKSSDAEVNTSSELNSSLSYQEVSRDSFSSPLKLEDLETFPRKEDKTKESDNRIKKTPDDAEKEFEPFKKFNQSHSELKKKNKPSPPRAPSPPPRAPSPPVEEPPSIIAQSPLLTSLLMKESPIPNFISKPPPMQQPKNSQYNLYNESSNLLNNNITVEKSKEPGIKLKFNLQNASSPVIVSSNYHRIDQVTPTTVKPPNRTRRPPKRFDDSPPATPIPPTTPIPPPAPSVMSLKTTIYDIHPTQTDILNRVPKLTVRVPREILEKQFSSDSSESEEENKLTMDIDDSLNKEPLIQKADTTMDEKPIDVQDSTKNDETEISDVEDLKIPPDKIEPPDDLANKEPPPTPAIALPLSELKLNQPLDKYPLKELLQICVTATMWNCIYCNHVRKIAVNCKTLSLHILENHRFSATVDSITAEELLPETINLKIKNELEEFDSVFMNLSSSDNADKTECSDFDHIFECFQCYFKTPVHKELYFHNRKMHQKAIIICFMCKSNFYSYSELLCHLCPGNISSEHEIHYRCCFCRADNIPSSFRLMVHLRKIHHTCEVCLERCWNQTKLSMHVWKHKLHHLCYRCGIAYRNKPDITKHLFWKHGTESIICKRCMQKKWPHIYHFCIPPVTFVCEECKLSFTKAVSLRVHKRFHVAEFPHVCTEKDCNEMFVSKKLLVKHAEKHKPLVIDLTPNDDVNNDAPNTMKQETEEAKEASNANPETTAVNTVASNDTKVELSNKKSKKKRNKDKDLLLDVNLPELNLSESDSSEEESEDASATNKDTANAKTEIIISDETNKLQPDNKLDVSRTGESKKEVDENEESTPEKNNTDKERTDSEANKSPSKELLENDKNNQTEEGKIELPDVEKVDLQKTEKQEPPEVQTKVNLVTSPVAVKIDKKFDEEKITDKSDSNPVEAESKELINVKEGTELEDSKVIKEESDNQEKPENKENEDEKKRSEQQVLEIWDNFKQYQAKVEKQKSPERPKTPPLVTIRKHVCESDHDYCLIPVETNGDQSDRRLKKKKWRRSRSRSVSSSSSSSNSGTSCSCGSNCSCSSSGSSSSSSDSESYVLEDRRADKSKRKMSQRRESQVSIDVTAPEDTPVLVPEKKEPEIAESDLQTEESDTDEDCYDEHPQKLANKMYTEKHNRLMMLATVAPSDTPEGTTFGLIDDTVSQLPPVPEEHVTDVKKKRKAKRRKKQKSPKKKPQKPIKLNIPKQKILPPLESSAPQLAPNKITISLHSNTVQIGNPPDVTTPRSFMSMDQEYLSSEQRASKRRRRPNKFYGYTSDEETRSKVTVREPFNPYLPPKFEWKKEDLPSPASSHRIPTHRVPSILEPSIRLTAPITDPVPPQILMNSDSEESSDSDSSGGQLHISQTDHCFTPSYPQPVEEPITEPKVQTFSNNEDSLYNPENTGNPFPSFMPQSTQSLVAQNPYASHLFRFRRPQGMRPAREGESVYCYCRCPYDEVSEMIGCDAPGCSIEWFHFECVGIMVPPKGKWYCPDCKMRMGLA